MRTINSLCWLYVGIIHRLRTYALTDQQLDVIKMIQNVDTVIGRPELICLKTFGFIFRIYTR